MRSKEASANTTTLTYPGERITESGTHKLNPSAKIRQHSRDHMTILHQPSDAIVKTTKTAGSFLKDTVDSSSQIMTNLFLGVRDKVKDGAKAHGTSAKLGLGALAGVFGLKSVQGVLDLIKSIFGQNAAGKRGPGIILSAGQALFGSAMALGVFRAFAGSPGMFNFGTITLGLGGFALLSMIKNNYQNPNSFGARILGMLGIGDSLNGIVDSIGFNERVSNEVLK